MEQQVLNDMVLISYVLLHQHVIIILKFIKIFLEIIFKCVLVHSSLHGRIVVAVYNYQSREMSDVSFVKGDRMELLDDSELDWWRVRHLRTGEEGLIPWNFVAEEKSVESEE
jgi:hypothetical protein